MDKKGKKDYLLSNLPGVDEKIVKKLNEQDINTTMDLLKMSVTRNDRDILSDLLDIHAKHLLSMANMCDLLRIGSVTPAWAWLLEKVGVDTIPELAQRNARYLYNAIEKYNIVFIDEVKNKPDADVIGGWVEDAKKMDRMLEY